MRVTSSMYFNDIYASNNSKLSKELFDVNKQISSGLKIQYAKDDVSVFTQTMRLDNEMTTLTQVKKSVENAYKFSNQTDTTLNDFGSNLDRMKTLLIQAASAANSDTSLDALSTELRGLEKSLKGLANTSINGQYLFSGSAVNTRPIAEDGTYRGNDTSLDAFLGSNSKQTYNLSGSQLFLGENPSYNREITTNVVNRNLLSEYQELQNGVEDEESLLTPSSTIRNLMGDTDDIADGVDNHFFYVRGTQSDGTAFKEKFSMSDNQTIDELLDKIGALYGNTPNLDLVNVSLNNSGQIVIEDKQSGSSKIDFHMVGAVDFSGGAAADVDDTTLLDSGETDFKEIINPTTPPANPLFVKEFVKSDFAVAPSAGVNLDALEYDRVAFEQNGSKLSSNVSQVLKSDNSFATNTTKLSEVFSGDPADLDGKTFNLQGTQVDGVNSFDIEINLSSAGSTFTDGTDTYNIYNVDGSAVAAEDMTYKQLMDVVNAVVTGEFPDASYVDDSAAFHQKIKEASLQGDTYLTHDGKMEFGEKNVTTTKASMALFDANSSDFSATSSASVATFNANNALTVTDPKTDFFKEIDRIISAVEEYKLYPDAKNGSARTVGIQNAIAMIDDVIDHTTRSQTQVGAQSNALTRALERTEFLEVSTMSLRSSVIDTDLAEASLRLTQLSLNYEAMLSTVGRISKLTLVNYL